jgi:hypothetical protein
MVKRSQKKKASTRNGTNKTARAARPRTKPRQRMRRPTQAALSECAQKYLNVLENPFSGAIACVPSLTNFPTMKHSVRSFGTAFTGTNGFGFVCATPFQGAFNDGLFISGSTQLFTGIVIGTGGGNFTGLSNSPYTTALSERQVQIRVVGCGLRVRNITPLLNRGGVLVGAESLGHRTVVGLDDATMLQWDTAERLAATTDKWSSVVWHPNDEDEFDFLSAAQCGVDPYILPTLAFVFRAPGTGVGTAQQYEWESYLIFEAKGSVVHGLTPSMSDPSGLATVQNSVMPVRMRKPTQASKAQRVADILGNLAMGAGYAANLGVRAYRAYNALNGPPPNGQLRRITDIETVD